MPDFKFIEDKAIREKVEDMHKLEVDELTVNLNNKAKKQVDDAVAGLKTKNSDILNEKKTLQESLKSFEGIDPILAKDALKFHEENKDAQFMKDGKLEDLIEQKTSVLKSDHEAEMTELLGKFDTTSKSEVKFKSLYESKVIEDGLREAAMEAKVRGEALSDVILRGRTIFTLDEKNLIEARDSEGKLAKTQEGDKVLTPKNWIEELKLTSPHYWPGSKGANAPGGSFGNDSDYDQKLADAADKGDMTAYRKLRDGKK